MAQGQDLIQKGQDEEAKLVLEKALQAQPENTAAHFHLANILQRRQRYPEALDHYRAATADNSPEHLLALARLLLQTYLENPSLANLELQLKDVARKLRSIPSAQAEVARIEGYLAVLERRNEDAIRHFQASLSQAPKQEDVRLALFQQLLAAGRDADALALLPVSQAQDVLAETYYLHLLSKSGCEAAEKFLVSPTYPAQGLTAALKRAAHQRRCQGAAAEAKFLAPLREQSNLTRTDALVLGDYDAQQSNWAAALAMYDKAASLPPSPNAPSGSLEIRRSSALIGLGRFAEAAPILDAYLKAHPDDANAKGQRGLLRLNGSLPQTDPAQGLQDLREALASSEAKTLPALRLQFAMNLLRLGYLSEAKREMQQLAQTMPGALAVEILQAELELRDGRPQLAEKRCTAILLQDPKQREARLIRALSLSALQDPKEATKEFRKLAQDYPQDESIAVQFLAALSEDPTAQPEFTSRLKALSAQPKLSPPTRFVLAEILQRNGQSTQAQAIWQSLASEASEIRASLRLAEIALSQGQASQACPSLEALAAKENTWPSTTRAQWWALRAICAEFRKEPAQAIQAHRKALELSPRDPVLANNLASTLADQGQNLDEAQRLAEAALSTRPDNIQYLDTLGWVYYRKGDQNRARQIYQRLSDQKSLPPNVAAHSAQVLGTR